MQAAHIPRSQLSAVYNAIAPTHDLLAVLVEDRARRIGLQWANVKDGEDVLEVAVGTGLNFWHLLRANPRGHTEGVDISPVMLAIARYRASLAATSNRKVPLYKLRRADAYNLPHDDASFDLIYCSYLFDMLPKRDFTPVIREFLRVLRPHGRMVLVNKTLNETGGWDPWEAIYRLNPYLLGGCRGIKLAPHIPRDGVRRVQRKVALQLGFPSEIIRVDA